MPVQQLVEMPQHVALVQHGCVELVSQQDDPGAGFAGCVGCHKQLSSLRLAVPSGGHHRHEAPAVPAEPRQVPPFGLGIEAVRGGEAQDLANAAHMFAQVLPQEANGSGADACPDGFQLERFQIRPLDPHQLLHAVENVTDAGQTGRFPGRRAVHRLRHAGAPAHDGVPHAVGGVHRRSSAGKGLGSPQPAPQSIDVSGKRVQVRAGSLPVRPRRSEGAPAVGGHVARHASTASSSRPRRRTRRVPIELPEQPRCHEALHGKCLAPAQKRARKYPSCPRRAVVLRCFGASVTDPTAEARRALCHETKGRACRGRRTQTVVPLKVSPGGRCSYWGHLGGRRDLRPLDRTERGLPVEEVNGSLAQCDPLPRTLVSKH